MSAAPPTDPKAVLYCCREADGTYHHFYPSRKVVQMFDFKDETVHVRLVPDTEGAYWCWHDYRDNEYCHVYDALFLLKMCFTYGIEIEEEHGKGIRVRVRVEELPEPTKEQP